MLDLNKIYTSNNCGEFQIVKYICAKNVTIKFIKTGTIIKTRADKVRNGKIKDYISPTVFNIGFIGKGNYKAHVGAKNTKAYSVWFEMIRRCYCSNSLKNNPTYRGCSVTKEWFNFQNFAVWFYENYIDGYHLDKDIKINGNKVYSADTCMFVTQADNSRKASAKNYIFVSPCGKRTEIYNLSEFCKNNGLNRDHMQSVLIGRGGRKQHKGWGKV